MTDLRKAAEMALEAMESIHRTGDTQAFDMFAAPVVIPALRKALEQPEQEPVAFVCRGKFSTIEHCEECEPLYAAPPKREWVGLTDEEREYLWGITPIEDEDRFAFVLAVEAKLKEKNHGNAKG